MNERAPRPERLVALFVAVLWAALAFAADGVLAILLDRDPVESAVGPYYAVVAFLIAGVVVWSLLAGTSGSRNPLWGALGATAAVYLVFVLVAIGWGLELVGEQATSPFVLTAALLAGLMVVAMWSGLRRLQRDRPPA